MLEVVRVNINKFTVLVSSRKQCSRAVASTQNFLNITSTLEAKTFLLMV